MKLVTEILGGPQTETVKEGQVKDLKEMAEQISDAKKLHAVLEHAAVKLARNEPLFSEIPTMQEYNERFRQELVRALCEVLRALEQSGQGAEKTAVSEKVLRTYTSG